jgi:hypothetical protein
MRITDVMIAHVEKVRRHIFRKRTPNAANLKVATAEDPSDKFERKQRARPAVRLAARVSDDPGPGGDPSVAQELSEGGAADGVGANIVHLSVQTYLCRRLVLSSKHYCIRFMGPHNKLVPDWDDA